MEYVELSNGVKMPIVGFGVYQIPREHTEFCTLEAIKAGYRLIDTAQSYFNEENVGNAIEKAINEGIAKREELFITSKVWIDNYGYDKCRESVLESIKKLKVDYLDLMLIHQPFSDYYGAYRALEDLYEEGKLKAIGVSNFGLDRLTDICLFERKVVPHVNQIETNPFNAQVDAQKNMEKYHVQIEAWAPFAEGRNNIFNNRTLVHIGKKYKKSAAQVILRWLIQRKVVVLSKTTRPERMKENLDVFNFQLSNDDMNKIAKLDNKTSSFFSHYDPQMVEWFDQLIEQRRKTQVTIEENSNN